MLRRMRFFFFFFPPISAICRVFLIALSIFSYSNLYVIFWTHSEESALSLRPLVFDSIWFVDYFLSRCSFSMTLDIKRPHLNSAIETLTVTINKIQFESVLIFVESFFLDSSICVKTKLSVAYDWNHKKMQLSHRITVISSSCSRDSWETYQTASPRKRMATDNAVNRKKLGFPITTLIAPVTPLSTLFICYQALSATDDSCYGRVRCIKDCSSMWKYS